MNRDLRIQLSNKLLIIARTSPADIPDALNCQLDGFRILRLMQEADQVSPD